MIYKKILVFILSVLILVPIHVSADVVTEKNINENKIVTEHYSDDIYDDIVVESSAIPMSTIPEIKAESAILMEASTGRVIYKKNENKKLPPASITKIMTMLLVVEAIESKKLSFYDKVSCSEHAASMGGSQIWLEPGEKMTVHDLLKSVAVGSANDASVALAEHISGSEETFVALMNSRAKELGMNNTNFANACGLDNDNLYTSAKDIALMSKELISHDIIKQYTTIWMDTIRNESVQLVNTNKLVRFYRGATGLKTGTTNKAGCCLSATAKRNNMELIAVIMGAASSNERFSNAKKLLDYGFANLTIYEPSKHIKLKDTLNVKDGQSKTVELAADKISNELIKTEDKDKIKIEVTYNEEVVAPIKKNDVLGKIKISNGDNKIKEYLIYAKNGVEKINFGFCLSKLLKGIVTL